MKTLLERLKPEFREKLEEWKDDFPNYYKSIIKKLNDNKFLCDLDYNTICNMDTMFFHYKSKSLRSAYELFNFDDLIKK